MTKRLAQHDKELHPSLLILDPSPYVKPAFFTKYTVDHLAFNRTQ
jgi:hypothetical protein